MGVGNPLPPILLLVPGQGTDRKEPQKGTPKPPGDNGFQRKAAKEGARSAETNLMRFANSAFFAPVR